MDAKPNFDERELNKRDAILLEALRQALTSDEHRLYRSGKLEGLFPSRTGAPGEAAALAIREQLLEYIRTEARGRFEIDWVRLTSKGIEYLYQHDSPKAVLTELRKMLQSARTGIPIWQDEMLQSLEKLGQHISNQMERYIGKLDGLTKRIDEALRRIEISPEVTSNLQQIVPWALDALTYIDRRQQSGAQGACPLPELFGALKGRMPEIRIRDFHDGLRRLSDNQAINLSPFPGPGGVPFPEFLMMCDGQLMYFVSR